MSAAQPEHTPVLVEPLLKLLAPAPGDCVLDGTVGLGGHALALLPAIQPGGRYIGLDVDEKMLAAAAAAIKSQFDASVELAHSNYADFRAVLDRLGVAAVNHMLLDLGVNSKQLDDPQRGFSFDEDGPLDMRFDQSQTRRALDLVNSMDESALADLFYEFGQEGLSRRIARRICQVRHGGRITTTRTLASAVESAHAAADRGGGGKHPATRVFQALRIAVNDELGNLKRFLAGAAQRLAPGGKLAIISFHSLEDGIVKDFLRQSRSAGLFEDLTPRPVVADPQERGRNPRSRSAKLRVARRIAA